MRFFCRADGSADLGLGHLARVIAVGAAARRVGVEAELLVARSERAALPLLEGSGLTVRVLDVDPGKADDAAATRKASAGGVLVVDGYHFSPTWVGSLRERGRTVVVLDDLGGAPVADVVVNPNVSGTQARYEVEPGVEVHAGPPFVLVREPFLRARGEERRSGSSVPRVLVTMGGSDPPGATLRVIEELLSARSEFKVRIVVGSLNPRRDAIRSLLAPHAARFEACFDVFDLASELLGADVIVAASGVTSAEIACVGVPGVVFPIVDNQAPNAAELRKLALFDVLPLGGGPTGAIVAAVERLVGDASERAAQIARQRRTIDGLGADRIVARLMDTHARRERDGTQTGAS